MSTIPFIIGPTAGGKSSLAVALAQTWGSGEILTADWWRGIQERLREGDVLEVLPYHKHRVRVFSSL